MCILSMQIIIHEKYACGPDLPLLAFEKDMDIGNIVPLSGL